jgi:hypothetical protein
MTWRIQRNAHFPTPKVMGDPASIMTWVAFRTPLLESLREKKTKDRSHRAADAAWQADITSGALSDDRPIKWPSTQNGHPETLAARFLVPDRSIAVDLDEGPLWAMRRLCANAGSTETGGVLLGKHSGFGDRVLVRHVIGPPPDSIHHRFDFVRGVVGLARRLRRAWEHGEYYVGEWHFHPHSPPTEWSISVSVVEDGRVVSLEEQPGDELTSPDRSRDGRGNPRT